MQQPPCLNWRELWNRPYTWYTQPAIVCTSAVTIWLLHKTLYIKHHIHCEWKVMIKICHLDKPKKTTAKQTRQTVPTLKWAERQCWVSLSNNKDRSPPRDVLHKQPQTDSSWGLWDTTRSNQHILSLWYCRTSYIFCLSAIPWPQSNLKNSQKRYFLSTI